MRLRYVASFDIVKMRLYYASAEHVHVHCNVKRVIEGERTRSFERKRLLQRKSTQQITV